MGTLLMSQDLWDTTNTGYNSVDQDRQRLQENKKRDGIALASIQQAVHDNVFFKRFR
ncbi:hypothetical protein Hanom_Chr11g00981871 [Helianthus anomalus]